MRYLDLRKWSWILFASSALLLEVCEGGRGGEVLLEGREMEFLPCIQEKAWSFTEFDV